MALTAVLVASVSAQPKVIAHRGYWKTAGSAQNSRTSFLKADSIGVYGSEMDVWLTSDDQLIVNHDKDFQGCDIENTTKKEITSLVLANGEKVPTLQQYLKVVKRKPNTRLVLEMKSLKSEERENLAVQKIVKLLKRYKVAGQTDIIAFSLNACKTFKRLQPDARIYYLNGDLSPVQIKALGLAGIDYSLKVIKANPQWVKEAHDLGLEVNVWTLNSIEDFQASGLLEMDVDYITTDAPVLFLDYFRNSGR
jgi:Glycerophosphoryl diester phosphodiesterase